MFYKKQLRRICNECPNMSTFRLYLYLAGKQTYNNYVMIAPQALMKQLKMSKAQFYRSIKWLKQNEYLTQVDVEGNVGWLLNPNWTGCGIKSLKERKELWQKMSLINKAIGTTVGKKTYTFEKEEDDESSGDAECGNEKGLELRECRRSSVVQDDYAT